MTDARKRTIVDDLVRNSGSWMQGVDTADLRGAFRLEDIPSTAPAFEAVAVDLEGNAWVGLGPVPAGGLRHDVFDSTGAWLGEVIVPLDQLSGVLAVWGRGWLVAVTEGDDGRPAIVRLRREGS